MSTIVLAMSAVCAALAVYGLAAVIQRAISGVIDTRAAVRAAASTSAARDAGRSAGMVHALSSVVGGILRRREHARIDRFASELDGKIIVAGLPYARFDGYAFAGAHILAGLAGLIASVVLWGPSPMVLVLSALTGAVPTLALNAAVRERHRLITADIPEFLDMVSLMAGAGMDLISAIERYCAVSHGPLAGELRDAAAAVRMGRPRGEVWRAMAARIGLPALTGVVDTFVLVFETGGEVADSARDLAGRLRHERAQAAEKKAQEAPLKLMVPLALLIFPTIFIILFGPMLISFVGGRLW